MDKYKFKLHDFFAAGYPKENLMDANMLVGNRTISNILHAITKASC